MTKMWCESCRHWLRGTHKTIGECTHPDGPGPTNLNRFKHNYESCLMYEQAIQVGIALEDTKDGITKCLIY